MEWMGAREMVVGHSQKGSIMVFFGMSMRSAPPGVTFGTISHPNSINTMNSTRSNKGTFCHSKLVPFIVVTALIMVTIMRMSSITATLMVSKSSPLDT